MKNIEELKNGKKIMAWVNEKADETRGIYDSYRDYPRIQKRILRDFVDYDLSKIKWSKHHSDKVRTYVKFYAIARVTETKYDTPSKELGFWEKPLVLKEE